MESFRGIPFAQPPIGNLRLRPPRRLVQNIGKLDATILGSSCPQLILSSGSNSIATKYLGKLANNQMFQKAANVKEDCLTLNIQRPAGTSSSSKLPVIYWFFGGAFEVPPSDSLKFGTNNVYDATGIINLSRLGLEWVADNIQAFGGDPSRVTLWGESSGSVSVFDQMLLYEGNNTYKGKPLFRGAIMDSGSLVPAQPVDSPKAQAIYDSVVSASGCEDSDNTLDCLRNLPYDQFLNAANAVTGIFTYSSLALSYLPRPDGITLTQSPEVLVRNNSYAAIPMIIGDQEDEGTVFSLMQTNLTSTAAVAQYLKDFYFEEATLEKLIQFVDTYPDDPTVGSPFRTGNANELYPGFKRLSAILGDIVFTLARRMFLANAKTTNPNVPAWSYLSSYNHGLPFLGTFHSSDIVQVFYGIPSNFAGRAIQTYYINFINSQNPNVGTDVYMNWPKWGDDLQLVNFFCRHASLLKDDFRQESYEFIARNVASLHF
ncbi:carboxylesterase, type b [Grosmannia clavigera kw1407]|uniref:Carboxylic ester hydrolase n=1 Tax=Grosmannia clavigera (strain kw1407 / UAMH 11150) TaxID=655863 RepID=F0XNW8_GROCL|nr:carboxylesterase, type b [Grosmannia clavigera kw1407]EFX00556.1 carboxylesterase, type b [Grosmannia clavigera kw1407]